MPTLVALALVAYFVSKEELSLDDLIHRAAQFLESSFPNEVGNAISCNSLSAIDGDTVKCDGVNMRAMGPGSPHLSGFDTPEITRPKCEHELELGRAAKARMQELLETPGVQIRVSGEIDSPRYKRPLVWIKLPDGRTAGEILIEEGHARFWTPEYRANWC
ncbi:thermonuclease family protein [uncultured Roseibium sp.]|uniref:thermonuclease family protein n=1 Tax=uncultured Roseibium sp. TaxID=1936171 RepID=UPI00260C5BDC|nr:thermonuclease family protein [uncultured Roseibium sp.]